MDGFTGFKTAAAEEVPHAVAVMDPFHVTRLTDDALDLCRRRVQQQLHGHRGRKNDPLYATRRVLHTGSDLLTDKQKQRLEALFAVDEHVQVEATWSIYQRMIAAYREPDRTRGRDLHPARDRTGVRALGAAVARRIGFSIMTSAQRPRLLRPLAPFAATIRPDHTQVVALRPPRLYLFSKTRSREVLERAHAG